MAGLAGSELHDRWPLLLLLLLMFHVALNWRPLLLPLPAENGRWVADDDVAAAAAAAEGGG